MEAPKLFANLFAALLLLAVVITIHVVARDARRRGKSALLVVLLCLVSFPLGMLLWLVFRPEPLDEGRRPFRLEDRRVQ